MIRGRLTVIPTCSFAILIVLGLGHFSETALPDLI